ncbi:2-hydroxyacid dehydrogenase [Acinetobacter johnsonii]|uniref:2-hydroxyacid dehydrogenase n=1 Tax=Acinetobacter johnsonii TaxID=40214 RepID=UPI00244CD0C8|nr:2-hydroxyacid dehydrogenase [Acinetobacter johnsonii]MDH2045344.1 2-hydroxyacid dehydrogenase [Acinetobacter johnsonii]
MKAVFLDYASLDKNDLDFHALHAVFDELILYPSTDAETLVARVQDADVIISNKVMVDADTLKQCSQLKLILISATGTNNIDLQQAKAQGVVVCNCQGYGTAAVAQHTLMLMLNLATSCLQYERAVQRGEWNKASQFCLLDYPIIELSGKTLGILGYGELGQAVAKLAEAFGMRVLVGNLPNRPHADSTRVGFDDLLAQSDFVSLHCPLTDDTRDLIDAQAFAKMKKSAFLINCARGGIVNEASLADALKQGEIAGAATDVLTVEPPKEGNVLLEARLPNLIITPHSAWGSVDARQRMVQQLVENAQAFQAGQPIRRVN